jgi:hypothetical protein
MKKVSFSTQTVKWGGCVVVGDESHTAVAFQSRRHKDAVLLQLRKDAYDISYTRTPGTILVHASVEEVRGIIAKTYPKNIVLTETEVDWPQTSVLWLGHTGFDDPVPGAQGRFPEIHPTTVTVRVTAMWASNVSYRLRVEFLDLEIVVEEPRQNFDYHCNEVDVIASGAFSVDEVEALVAKAFETQ